MRQVRVSALLLLAACSPDKDVSDAMTTTAAFTSTGNTDSFADSLTTSPPGSFPTTEDPPVTSSTTDTSTTADATDTDPEPSTGEPLSCAAYCETLTTNCQDTNGQYFAGVDGGLSACMVACAAFPEGTKADTAGNTLGCRAYHGGPPAANDAALHCEHAGPGGAGVCGSDCEGFCAIALAVCGSVYADESACMAECATFPDDVAYNTTAMAGDSLACRLYHLTAAAVDPFVHCAHINAASPTCM